MTHPGGEPRFDETGRPTNPSGRPIPRTPLSTRHPESPRPTSNEASSKSRGLSGPLHPTNAAHPVSPKLSGQLSQQTQQTSYRQDKAAAPAAVRSVSTPRGPNDLRKKQRVYRRAIAIPPESTQGRLADTLCAELWREAWQRSGWMEESAGIAHRSRTEAADDERDQ